MQLTVLLFRFNATSGEFLGCLTSQQHASVSQTFFAQTIVPVGTLRQKWQIKLAISPKHSTSTPGQPVLALSQTPAATRTLICSSFLTITGKFSVMIETLLCVSTSYELSYRLSYSGPMILYSTTITNTLMVVIMTTKTPKTMMIIIFNFCVSNRIHAFPSQCDSVWLCLSAANQSGQIPDPSIVSTSPEPRLCGAQSRVTARPAASNHENFPRLCTAVSVYQVYCWRLLHNDVTYTQNLTNWLNACQTVTWSGDKSVQFPVHFNTRLPYNATTNTSPIRISPPPPPAPPPLPPPFHPSPPPSPHRPLCWWRGRGKHIHYSRSPHGTNKLILLCHYRHSTVLRPAHSA